MRLINETQQFKTEELKAFLKRIAKGINTHNLLVIVKNPRKNRRYVGNVKIAKYSYYHYQNNGHDIRSEGYIKIGVNPNNQYPYKLIHEKYGEPNGYFIVQNPLNLLAMIFLHELYGAKLARKGKNHYQHMCDAWAYKRGKALGLFMED